MLARNTTNTSWQCLDFPNVDEGVKMRMWLSVNDATPTPGEDLKCTTVSFVNLNIYYNSNSVSQFF